MKKMQLDDSKSHRFFSGRGFYIALAVGLLAVGGAAWLGVNAALDGLGTETESLPITDRSELEDDWALPSEFEANVPKDDVPADPDPALSSSEAASEPSEQEPAEETQAPAQAAVQGYILPIKGEILNPYSGDKVVKSKTLDDWVMHTGMDISAEEGTPVKAMSGGTVQEVANDELWGTTVTIAHADGIVSFYANLKPAVSVQVGQTVKLGDVIGNVGNTADIERAEESHLHFGVKQNDEWIDPASLCK